MDKIIPKETGYSMQIIFRKQWIMRKNTLKTMFCTSSNIYLIFYMIVLAKVAADGCRL